MTILSFFLHTETCLVMNVSIVYALLSISPSITLLHCNIMLQISKAHRERRAWQPARSHMCAFLNCRRGECVTKGGD